MTKSIGAVDRAPELCGLVARAIHSCRRSISRVGRRIEHATGIRSRAQGKTGGFRLVRYFSLAGAAAFLITAATLVLGLERSQNNLLLTAGEEHNVALARSFANSVWATYSSYLSGAQDLDGNALRARPETSALDATLRQLTTGLPVLKVKIFHPGGKTLYSSEASQIGESKESNPAFRHVVTKREAVSKLSRRGSMTAFSSQVFNVDVIETYVPIQDARGEIATVFEIYTDVTRAVARNWQGNIQIALLTSTILGVLFLFLRIFVRRAYWIIIKQHAALATFKSRLEERVEVRTRDLVAANNTIAELNNQLRTSLQKLKEAQDENIRRGKLAQLGQLTATVAHEIRNPLGTIRTASYLMERKLKDQGLKLESQIERMNSGIRRCDRIITELLDFTRSSTLQQNLVGIDSWVFAIVQEERRVLPSSVDIVCKPGLGSQSGVFDTDRMRRVLINLLSNASEAMVGKGHQKTEMGGRFPQIEVMTRLVDGDIEVEVKDNGPGISSENLGRILEPLFTTKSFGIGLGLPAVQKILEQHGGTLKIASTFGEGASVTARWPLVTELKRAA